MLPQYKSLSLSDKDYCDKALSLKEVIDSIVHLKNKKSPGADGVSSEFYKMFPNLFAPFLLRVFCERIDNHTLAPTLTQGLISLIPKPKKDLLLLDHWRPVCLLNVDDKIFVSLLVKRIKKMS